jgi:hypothetical protein
LKLSGQNAGILLAHDGELDDVRAMLSDLDVPLLECRRVPPDSCANHPWCLVIATPRLMLELVPEDTPDSRLVRIAIGDAESKTLRTALSRIDVDYFVRRPVHSESLRLLILHALYRGPEKRKAKRVSIGAPVRFRTALRRRSGILIDLSETGCRLQSEKPADPGLSIKVAVPKGRNLKSSINVDGTVIRLSRPRGAGDNEGRLMHIHFERVSTVLRLRLQRILKEFGSGPASMPDAPATDAPSEDSESMEETAVVAPPEPPPSEVDQSAAPQLEDEDAALPAARKAERRTNRKADRATDRETEEASLPTKFETPRPDEQASLESVERAPIEWMKDGLEPAPKERRTAPRRIFQRQVVALHADNSHVLMGRDLSPGGMRTDPNPSLAVGDKVTVALPLLPGHTPLVVKAVVARDDGDHGLLLLFRDVTEEAASYLRHNSNLLPISDTAFEDEEPAGVIVSEILDRQRE